MKLNCERGVYHACEDRKCDTRHSCNSTCYLNWRDTTRQQLVLHRLRATLPGSIIHPTAHWCSRLTRCPLKAEITGSSPVCAANSSRSAQTKVFAAQATGLQQ